MKTLTSKLLSLFKSCFDLPDNKFRLFIACLSSSFLILAMALNSGILPILLIFGFLVWQAPRLRQKARTLPVPQTAMTLVMLVISLVLIIVLPPGMLWPIPVTVNRGAMLALVSLTRLVSSKPDKKMIELERQIKTARAKKTITVRTLADPTTFSITKKKRLAKEKAKREKKGKK